MTIRHPRSLTLFGGVLTALLLAGCGSDPITSPPGGNPGPEDPPDEPPVVSYEPGESYFGENEYVEYIAGNLPIILSAGHGGDLKPISIPDRTAARCGGSATTVKDMGTAELVLAMRDELFERFGGYPHVVINRLHRSKLDPNRDRAEAACGNGAAGTAWDEFQGFIDEARAVVAEQHGRGWYMDMHGHGHAIPRLELGYLLSRSDLNQDDDALVADASVERKSSIWTISEQSPLDFAELLRGERSLGALYEEEGFPAVPSFDDPSPGEDAYFSGGYNTRRHGCGSGATSAGGVSNGPVCGVQIEANRPGVRDTPANRARFAAATATVLEAYLSEHWELNIAPAEAN